jgi:hypothetical protein
MKSSSQEDATTVVVNWLNIHAPFSEIALFHKRIPNDVSLLSWRMNRWLVHKERNFRKQEDEYHVGYSTNEHYRPRRGYERRMQNYYSRSEIKSIKNYEISKGLSYKDIAEKYLEAQKVSWKKEIVPFLKWKFDVTDYESDELFKDIDFYRDSNVEYAQSDKCLSKLSELPEKLMDYQQREIDYQYIPGGKLYKRAQLDFNVTKKGVDDSDFQRRSPEELGPYRLEEKTIHLAISCIQKYFGNNQDMAFQMIKMNLLKDNEEFPMLIAVLEKYDISLADYLSQVVINAVESSW